MREPKISIFTYSYNNHGNIAVAIKSVLRQTFLDFEYLIFENSDDGLTRGIVRNFNDARIKLFEEKGNGKSYAINKYFRSAAGKYIAVLSDNNILMTNCFAEHIKAFDMEKISKANSHGVEVIFTFGEKPGYQTPPNTTNDIGTIVFERSLLKDLPSGEVSDEIFIQKLSLITKIYPIYQALQIKRITTSYKGK